MTRFERTNTRDLAFSRWHRALPRDDLTWLDLDYYGYCHKCRAPLFLLELARDSGQEWKANRVGRELARRLEIPALVVLYSTDCAGAIRGFRIRRVAPTFTAWQVVEPNAFARWIERQHDEHACGSLARRAA